VIRGAHEKAKRMYAERVANEPRKKFATTESVDEILEKYFPASKP